MFELSYMLPRQPQDEPLIYEHWEKEDEAKHCEIELEPHVYNTLQFSASRLAFALILTYVILIKS
jgi:hypothetical protein